MKRRAARFPVLLALFLGCPAAAASAAEKMPASFVYLRDVDPAIRQDMRYAGYNNFLGRPAEGYLAAECVLTLEAARALERAQNRLENRGLSLKVFDCYRPARAVAHFMRWVRDPDGKNAAAFHPGLKKASLSRLGYIAGRSGHSRGSTVDLAIVETGPSPGAGSGSMTAGPCHRQSPAPGNLDFGTEFDCFHPRSHTASPDIGAKARENRKLLVETMQAAGFRNYHREWWHFTLETEPFPATYFDFPIIPRTRR